MSSYERSKRGQESHMNFRKSVRHKKYANSETISNFTSIIKIGEEAIKN